MASIGGGGGAVIPGGIRIYENHGRVIALRDEPLQLAAILKGLGYVPLEGARNFQFEKPIPSIPPVP